MKRNNPKTIKKKIPDKICPMGCGRIKGIRQPNNDIVYDCQHPTCSYAITVKYKITKYHEKQD